VRLTTTMRTALRSVGHHETLSTVDHLDELRTRLFVVLAVVGAAFAVCFWQNNRLLTIVNAPLAHQTEKQVKQGRGPLGATYTVQIGARDVAVQVRALAAALSTEAQPAAVRSALSGVQRKLGTDVKRLSAPAAGDHPVTLGIGEPFMTTITVSLAFALILSLPVLLFQIYAFFIPAIDPVHRRRVRPVLWASPGLFIVGVLFGYFVVLPSAIHFLENFNSGQFETLVQASQYYSFAATILVAMGLVFQVPLAILALTQSGTMTPGQLRRGRRYAIGACAAVAAFLPGDVVTMLLETVPLYLLFELGVLIASVLERRGSRHGLAAMAATGG
jgi:sec-independent protein translocase protein TatC